MSRVNHGIIRFEKKQNFSVRGCIKLLGLSLILILAMTVSVQGREVTLVFDGNDLIDLYPAEAGDENVQGENKSTQVNARRVHDEWNNTYYETFYNPAGPHTQPNDYNTYLNWRDGLTGTNEGIAIFNNWFLGWSGAATWGETWVVKPDTPVSATVPVGWNWREIREPYREEEGACIQFWTTDPTKYIRKNGTDLGLFSITVDLYKDTNSNGMWDTNDEDVDFNDTIRMWFGGLNGDGTPFYRSDTQMIYFDDSGWGTRTPSVGSPFEAAYATGANDTGSGFEAVLSVTAVAPMDACLVGAYFFDEGTGTTANDSSGNENHGTISGAQWEEGEFGTVLTFDGTNDYVNIPADSSLNTQSFTVDLWLKPTYKGTEHDGFLFSAPAWLRFSLNSSSHKVWVRWKKADQSYCYYYLTTSAVPENEWTHLAFTYDSVTDTLIGYMNGELEVSNTNVGGLWSGFGGDIRIGYANNCGEYFLGSIDDVRFYNEALTAEDILYSYENKGLVGCWKLDEGENSTAYDISGYENDGTITGATWDEGEYGFALKFDGDGDYVYVPSDATLTSESFSVEAWINPTGNFYTKNYFLYSYPSYLRFFVGPGIHPLQVRWRKDDATGTYINYTLVSSSHENEWIFVSAVYDNVTDTLKGYKNGVLDNIIENVGGLKNGFGGALKMGTDSVNGYYFKGLMGEVRVYDRILTDAEVANHFSEGEYPVPDSPSLGLTFSIETRDATNVTLTLNGETVTKDGDVWPLTLTQEGLNIIGMTAEADGANPGLRLTVSGCSDLETRWRAKLDPSGDWQSGNYNDTDTGYDWPVIQPDGQGYLPLPSGTGTACFRQIVLWAEKHYDGLPALQPKVREWGFSKNSMETFFHPLYSPPPLAFDMSNYEFILDVPTDFSLLQQNFNASTGGGQLNRAPSSITTQSVQHDSQNYTRYRFAYESTYVTPYDSEVGINMALIPMLLGNTSITMCNFYFHRLASGNITEIEQSLPVRVLPEINGSMPENVAIQQYLGVPWRYHTFLYPEHFNAHMTQSLAAGFNHWGVFASSGEYGKAVCDTVLEEENGRVILLGTLTYPLWGNAWGSNCVLGQLMSTTPDSQARFFNDACTWQQNTGGYGWRFCPSWAAGPGSADFKAAVKSDIQTMLTNFQGAATYLTDWEQTPWRTDYSPYLTDETAPSYCFCDNCKAAFYNTYPEIQGPLTDDQIKANYKSEWSSFREELDGAVNGIVRDACNELGLAYMVYDDRAHDEFWTACSGEIDAAFPGLPGGDVCYSDQQAYLDSRMEFFRNTVGLSRVIGQQFAATYDIAVANPWDNWISRQEGEGFWNPKMVKLQILRIVASLHGGVDLCSATECFAGMKYYIGEATRIISTYDDLFWSGIRDDDLASSNDIDYPNLLVLKNGTERLVLLFNEGTTDLPVTLDNLNLQQGQQGQIFGTSTWVPAAQMEVTVPAEDVLVIHIQ